MDTYGYAMPEVTKATCADWLGEVPVDWDIKKMKFLFRDHSQKGQPDATLLSVTQGQGVVPRTWVENRMVMPSGNLESFKFIEKEDFAISLRSFEGGLEYCHHDGIISPAYTVLKRRHTNLDSGYYRYLFKSYAFISELQTSVVGIREGKNISFEELSYSLMPIPPLPTQRAIVAFLDEKCAKIDGAVKIKEDQITLLRERRQIIIQEAVTRGLNPAAPMKDSGIDWIGQIPAQWEVMRLKYLLSDRLKYGANEEATECVEGDPRYIRITDFGSNGKLRDDTQRTLPWKIANEYLLESGDILLARSGGTVGKAFKFRDKIRACFAGYLIRARADRKKMSPEYLYFFLRSPAFDCWKDAIFSRATIQNIGADKYATLTLPVPSLDEQNAILRHLDESEAKIEAAIDIKECQIAAIKEYKTSLINAAVTGKIRVI